LIKVGGVYAEVEFVYAAPGLAGVAEVGIKVPAAVSAGDAVPLVVQVVKPDGQLIESNTATITVEGMLQ
jgi:uncharacterized protein (TIGR03437 family)